MDGHALELEMARGFYGYGRWDAPYWFIGPEPGMGPNQPASNAPLLNAWLKSGKCDLCDCYEFQASITMCMLQSLHSIRFISPFQATLLEFIPERDDLLVVEMLSGCLTSSFISTCFGF
jgi:hypothetical protein